MRTFAATVVNPRGRASRRRALAIVEVTIGITALVSVSLLLLKASLSATASQRWTVIQGLTDAYMTRETAVSKRAPFSEIVAANSRWPVYPNVATEVVEIGRLPGGKIIAATIHRTRFADENNFWSAQGLGTEDSNPAKMEIWRLQSLLSYNLSGRDYVKTRTVVRSR